MKDDLKQVFVEKEKIFLNKLNFLKRIGKKLSKSDHYIAQVDIVSPSNRRMQIKKIVMY